MILPAKKGLLIPLLIAAMCAAWLPFGVFAEEGTPAPAEETTPALADSGTPFDNGETTPASEGEGTPFDNGETTPAPSEPTTPPVADAPQTSESSEPPAAEIVTGDAVAETEIQNFENTNILDTAPATGEASSTLPTEGGESSTTPLTQENSEATSTPVSTELTTDNTASTTNDSVTDAGTGSNSASENGGDASITTGTAAAGANVLNVVNTNILNSSGFFFLLNNFWGNLGSIDVRGMSAANDSLLGCESLCNGTSTPLRTTISTDNAADITNGVIVRGTSGGNDASDNGGDASIATGDAAAGANVVNIANTNFVDSNYMLLVFNNFGDWGGDLVFPNRDFFMNRFFGRASTTPPSDSGRGRTLSVDHENEAAILNDAETRGDTGRNEASANGEGVIRTGDAFSQTSVYNQANANFFNTDSFVVLFRVYGNWSGDVFNAPSNIGWTETPEGVALYENEGEGEENGSITASSTAVGMSSEESSAGEGATTSGEEGGVVSEAASTTPETFSSFSVKTKNKASIKNYVRVFALTGANRANRNRGSAEIETGNAYASANIVNIANTNVVGRNWVLAIVNIFGDWNGNVSFGQPDLWVGSSIDTHGEALPDSHPDYHFTVANRGDADATNVKLRVRNNKPFLTFNGRDVGGGKDEWDLGSIPAGTSVEVVYAADIGSPRSFPSYGEHEVLTTATVVSRETDNNSSDNTDIIGLVVRNPQRAPRRAALPYTSDPVLTITKTVVGSTSLYQGERGFYKIVIDNRGGEAYHSVLTDTLKNDAGKVINEQTWELQTILPNEEITITYETVFGASTTPGVYTNEALLHTVGRHESLDPFLGHFVDSNVASTSVLILYRPPEEAPALGGDGDVGVADEIAETTVPSGSGSAIVSVTATTTSVAASFVAVAESETPPQAPLTLSIEFPPLRKAAFATTSPEPSPEQILLAAAVNARATADEVRLYLLLILAAFLINQYYRRRILSGGGFAEFL